MIKYESNKDLNEEATPAVSALQSHTPHYCVSQTKKLAVQDLESSPSQNTLCGGTKDHQQIAAHLVNTSVAMCGVEVHNFCHTHFMEKTDLKQMNSSGIKRAA